MTIRRFFQVIYSAFSLCLFALGMVAVLLSINQRNLNRSQRVRYESYLLADELRQSSDDLTRFVRTYVATGDPKYEQFYWDVLAIRNGEKPRPAHYQRIYWDFLAGDSTVREPVTKPISLQQLMKDFGFTDAELVKLSEAQAASDSLVKTEDRAMHAVKGLFEDSAGAFNREDKPDRELATQLVNDQAYHQAKARIMKPIDDFFAMLDARTGSAMMRYEERSDGYLRIAIAILFMLLVLTFASWIIIQRRVSSPVLALQGQTETVAADIDRLQVAAREIARGDMSQSFTVQARQLRLASEDEIGHLARTHDHMIAGLQETGEAIAQLTGELSSRSAALKSANEELEAGSARLRKENEERKRAEDEVRAKSENLEVLNRTLQLERSKLLELTESLTLANEELKRLSEAKSEFVAAASHDLRTPLTTIMESIRLIDDGAVGTVSDRQRRYLAYALQETRRLRELIDSLLDVAKVEKGKMEVKPGRVNVTACLHEAKTAYETLTQTKSLRIAVEAPELPLWVSCDEGHYTRVLNNLLGNALKFTPAGGSVTLRAELVPGGMVKTMVRDTGLGIPHDQQHRLFQKFEQIRRPGAELHTGTGLGLALCRQLVELNGGTIGFESEENQGSTFYFLLPASPDSLFAERRTAVTNGDKHEEDSGR